MTSSSSPPSVPPSAGSAGRSRPSSQKSIAKIVITAAVERAGVEPASVDEVIIGQTKQSADAANLARVAALKAGFPVEVPAYTVMRQCGSGLQAIHNAVQAIRAEEAEIVVAGGIESMSLAPYYLRGARFGFTSGNTVVVDSNTESQPRSQPYEVYGDLTMGLTAENLAEKYRISREEQDAFALPEPGARVRRHRERPLQGRDRAGGGAAAQGPADRLRHRRASAQDEPRAAGQAPARVQGGRERHGRQLVGPQRRRRVPRAHVRRRRPRPGASSPWRPSADRPPPPSTRASWASARRPPRARRSSAPASASSDIGLIEVNEAFAAQSLAVVKELELDQEIVNVNGGAIALGHPLGCSGARILTTLLYEMRRRGTRYGLAGICIAGGQGMASIVEMEQ